MALELSEKIERETLLKQVFELVDCDDSGILETSELLVLHACSLMHI